MPSRLDVALRTLERDRVFVGLARATTEERLFEDAPRIARDFAAVKESLPRRVMPVTTAVVTFDAGQGTGGRTYAADKGGRAAEKGAPFAEPQPLSFDYFMGDEVEASASAVKKALASGDELVSVTVPAGTLVAVVPVPFSVQATVPMKAASIRARFFGDWLSQNGYRSAGDLGFKDIEVYHYRRRRFRKATKMVMELMFPIEKV